MAHILRGLQFYPGKSLVHRLDPRAKLIISASLLTVALLYLEISVISLVIIVEALLALISKTLKRWACAIYGIAPFIALVFLLNYVIKALSAGQLLDPQSLYESFAAAYRVIALLASFSIFFLTTTPEELGMALTKLRVPYIYTFAFISAIRFVPILAEELQSIIDAQRSRGLEFERGNPLTRLRRYIPILVPLIVSVLRRSYELAEAMEVKCFGASKKRTYLKELKLKRADYMAITLTILLLAIAIYLKLFQKLNLP